VCAGSTFQRRTRSLRPRLEPRGGTRP
jgi:hypothetical protein